MTVSIPQSLMFPKCSSYFVENNGKLVLSVCCIQYIKVYIAEKDDECQNVENLSMDPLIVVLVSTMFRACFHWFWWSEKKSGFI